MHITLTVFFSGSDQRIEDGDTLAGLLYHYSISNNNTHTTMGFNGCAVDYGLGGAIFGSGLDNQCQQVIEQIEAEIKKGNTITLNAYGHSRGANGALLLAKQLGRVDPALLKINLALLDPVPGNFITSFFLDFLGISLGNKTLDLRDCAPLQEVLVLYPNEPLDFYIAHAPLVTLYPEHTLLIEDVIPGCHSRTQFLELGSNEKYVKFTPQSFITYTQVIWFLLDHGSEFRPFPPMQVKGIGAVKDSDAFEETLMKIYDAEMLQPTKNITRDCHSALGHSIKTKEKANYVNADHQRLEGVPEDKHTARFTLEISNGPISRIKRAIFHYPKTWQLIKWSALGVGGASLLLFTGGLASLPALGSIFAQLGLWSIPIVTPFVGLALKGLWMLTRPVLRWPLNKFFYPEYHVREIQPPAHSGPDSTQLLVSGLNVKVQGPRSTSVPRNYNSTNLHPEYKLAAANIDNELSPRRSSYP